VRILLISSQVSEKNPPTPYQQHLRERFERRRVQQWWVWRWRIQRRRIQWRQFWGWQLRRRWGKSRILIREKAASKSPPEGAGYASAPKKC
jgi:hypothetical protein